MPLPYLPAIDVPPIFLSPVFHNISLSLTGFARRDALESEGGCVRIHRAGKG